MAHSQMDDRIPLKAASAIAAYLPVKFLDAASAVSETVVQAASLNDLALGFTSASVASPGDPISWWQPGDVAKGIAGASMGAGALVGVGSSNGVLAPVLASGLSTALGSALGAAGVRWAVGVVLKNAAAGDRVPVFVSPRQII